MFWAPGVLLAVLLLWSSSLSPLSEVEGAAAAMLPDCSPGGMGAGDSNGDFMCRLLRLDNLQCERCGQPRMPVRFGKRAQQEIQRFSALVRSKSTAELQDPERGLTFLLSAKR